jgi:hypothetical protein
VKKMMVVGPNQKIGGFDMLTIDPKAIRSYLDGWQVGQIIGWSDEQGVRPRLVAATLPDGGELSDSGLERLGWLLWGMGQAGQSQVALPGYGTLDLTWADDELTWPEGKTGMARVAVFCPTLWPISVIRLAERINDDLTPVYTTGTYPAVYVDIAVPGCARTASIRKFQARLTPGATYLAVILDRWATYYHSSGAIRCLFEYGDHHGGKYCAFYKLEGQWTLDVHAQKSGRPTESYHLAGTAHWWMDYTETERRLRAAQV